MVIDAEAALRAVAIVLETSEGHKTAIGSLQSCLLTGLSTFAGSLAGGPKGIVPGEFLSGLVTSCKSAFKSFFCLQVPFLVHHLLTF